MAAQAFSALDDAPPSYTAQAPLSSPVAIATETSPPSPFPAGFSHFIHAVKQQKELLLAGALERQCACDTWTQAAITIRADPAAKAVLDRRLRTVLRGFEGGEHTEITIHTADDGEILSEAEKQRINYTKAEESLMQSDEMRRIRNAFPQARITHIDIDNN